MKSPLSSLIWLSVRPLLRLRARRLARLIASELGAGDRVLDVGCGDLGIGKEVRKIVDVSWTGVDVLDYAFGYEQVEGLDFQKYDGKALPYPDGRMDVVIVAFVLHHCEDPVGLLTEAGRVVKRRLVVFEDIPEGRCGWFLVRFHDFLVNRFLVPDMSLPYGFKTLGEWTDLFESLGMRVCRAERLKTHPFAFVNQTLF